MTERVELAHLPTPVEEMPRLAAELGLARLLVKRDDLTGLALGGNKARKLERLCAVALAQGCDVLVTGGGAQSNHVRQTAAAANRIGLECAVALGGDEPPSPSGNLLLDKVLGAHVSFAGVDDYDGLEHAIDALAARLAGEGRTPFAIPIGGASIDGVLAYVDAVDELRAQGVDVDWVFVADGSGGTHAGLLAGFGHAAPRIVGVDVGTRPDLDVAVARLAREAAAEVGRPEPVAQVVVDHDHVGDGYGALSDAARAAIELTARTEGIVLDPVYTGKAMAALCTWVRDGRVAPNDRVLFWHTGGAPALFASRYAHAFD